MATDPTAAPTEIPDHAEARQAKLQALVALGIDPWGHRFDNHTAIATIRELPSEPFDDAKPGPTVRAAGRVVGRRKMGKLYFLDLQDQTGKVQLMLNAKQIGDLGWQIAELLDLGDIIGIDGEFGKTKMGEPTIRGKTLTFLTKSLEPHPSGYYGLSDVEYRLRHRYLDLLYTPDTLRRTLERITIVRTMRRFLEDRGYLEVETPVLTGVASGAAAKPFETHHNALDIPLVLRIALELPLKRLLVGGLEKVFEMSRVFRNEGISPKHNPEFTMLELYHAYGDLFTIMELTESVMVACVDALGRGRTIAWGETTLNFEPPFQRATYSDLFKEHVGVELSDVEGVRKRATELKMPLAIKDAKSGQMIQKEHDVLVNDLFGEHVEDKLVGPVFVCDYPAELCPLTKRKPGNPLLAERFELYVHGMELANAYTELNDPDTQAKTFAKQLVGQADEDSMAKMDDDFIRALRHGMPPAGGLGIGIDRFVMLLTNTPSIRDVILFPLMKPESK